VIHWKEHGKRAAVTESPRIDDAVDQYLEWLKAGTFRAATKRNWKFRMGVFKNSVQNVRVSEITPDFIDAFLTKRNTTPGGKDTDKRAISRFMSWCIERPRRWATSNPCREVKVAKGEASAPSVLTVGQCASLLRAAEAHKGGLLVPYVAVCLFGGLRPFEASRLPWAQVNLKDKEIRLEAKQTKTGTPRTVTIEPTLAKWLTAYKGREFYPANWRKEFDAVREAAGITEWPHDVLRHTAISHHFRLHNSYGKAAEQFGNSEAIIKAHYQGRVTSDETKKFYALAPKGKAKK
jgi:integrase